jgi:uracil-DNA glycosylase
MPLTGSDPNRKGFPAGSAGYTARMRARNPSCPGDDSRFDSRAGRKGSDAVTATSLRRLRVEAASCVGCDLYRDATQTVFGEGPAHPRLVLIGEQPGDKEDVDGRPFVGPAGRLLDRALAIADIDRRHVYLTNAVKHFKWTRGNGKVRIHQKPTRAEVKACAPWWQAELDVLRPELVVLLGATAAQAVLGSWVRVTRDRGTVIPAGDDVGYATLVTVHPSAVLRTRSAERDSAFAALVRDLVTAGEHVKAHVKR